MIKKRTPQFWCAGKGVEDCRVYDNNNIHGVIPLVGSGEDSVYTNLTPTRLFLIDPRLT